MENAAGVQHEEEDTLELVVGESGSFVLFLNGRQVARGGRNELLAWAVQRAEVAFGVPRALRRRRG